jgi:hypothetical protein
MTSSGREAAMTTPSDLSLCVAEQLTPTALTDSSRMDAVRGCCPSAPKKW